MALPDAIMAATAPLASPLCTSHLTEELPEATFAGNDTFTMRNPKLASGVNTNAMEEAFVSENGTAVALREAARRFPPGSRVVSSSVIVELSVHAPTLQ